MLELSTKSTIDLMLESMAWGSGPTDEGGGAVNASKGSKVSVPWALELQSVNLLKGSFCGQA